MYKGNLTKEEALQALKNGEKVGREYFSSDEYIHIVNGAMMFEDGILVMEWWNHVEPSFSQPEDGKAWYIWKESK